MPPEARAKGVAAKAFAKAAFAGKAMAQSAGLAKGRGAGPQGTLRPSEPAPVATGSPAAGPAGMPPKAKAKGAAAKAKAEAAAAGKAKARAETITTMKSPWRPLASLLKAICSVPYITSHPASEAV